jgi:hypothetical protein
MVGHTGAATDTRRIRRLRTPRPVEVQASEQGEPLRVRLGGSWQEVTPVRRPWRIDQQWWRAERTCRVYYRVAPEDGPPLTLYREEGSGEWFRQEY